MAEIIPEMIADVVIQCCITLATAGGSGPSLLPALAPTQASLSSSTPRVSPTQANLGSQQGHSTVQGSSNILFAASRAPFQAAQQQEAWVMVVVNSRGKFRLTQLDVQYGSSLDFFRRLRVEYGRLRGLSSRLFSVWDFSHCDFFEVCFIVDYQSRHGFVDESGANQ